MMDLTAWDPVPLHQLLQRNAVFIGRAWLLGLHAEGAKDLLAPEHAKRLLLSLQENIARYEANVGRINIPQGGSKEGIKGFNMGEA